MIGASGYLFAIASTSTTRRTTKVAVALRSYIRSIAVCTKGLSCISWFSNNADVQRSPPGQITTIKPYWIIRFNTLTLTTAHYGRNGGQNGSSTIAPGDRIDTFTPPTVESTTVRLHCVTV
jgi:hypothetical protein